MLKIKSFLFVLFVIVIIINNCLSHGFDSVDKQTINQKKDTVDWLECHVCELVVELMVHLTNENPNMNETEFHKRLDQGVCIDVFPDEWLKVYCELVVDQYTLRFYDIFVKRESTERACEWLGLCKPNATTHNKPNYATTKNNSHHPKNNNNNKKEDKIKQQKNKLLLDKDESYSFAVLSDMHIGQVDVPEYISWLSEKAVEKINSLIESENIKLAFVTGDITDSALPYQWTTAKNILNKLQIPYFPTLGNHDVWSYNQTGPYEEPYPTGDVKFANTFKDILRNGTLENATIFYNPQNITNPEWNFSSQFQNWELRYRDLVFLGLDWNTREHAIPGYKGALPIADLQNFPGGTLPWLKQTLRQIPKDSKNVVLFQHHPFAMPFFLPGELFSFSEVQLAQVQKTLETDGAGLKYWGLMAGHLHTWYNGTGLSAPPTQSFSAVGEKQFAQWLTEATKVGSAITLVRVDANGDFVSLKKLWGFDY